MKIHILGIVVLSFWLALATHIWVCNVIGLCDEKITNRPGGLENKIEKRVDSIKVSPDVAVRVAPGDLMIYFEFDRSDFRADSAIASYLTRSKSWMDSNAAAKLNITGYADAVGSDEYNQALGYRRAQTMQKYFTKNGLGSARIIIGSKGESDPADNNNTATGRANNRRAVIKIKI